MSKKHDTSKWISRDGYSHIDYLLENFHYRYLNEKYHVSDTFSDFVNSIIRTDLNRYFDDYVYTGWNFVDRECREMNDLDAGFPIMLMVVNDPYYPYIMSIADRVPDDDRWCTIYLTMNLFKMERNADGDLSEINAQTALFHECRHCLEMYVTDHNTITDCIYRSNDDLFVKGFSMGLRQKSLRTADLFVPSEQRARIDATIHYLRMNGGNWHNDSDIETLIEMTRDHNLVYLMEEELYIISETIQKYRENEKTETETLSMKDRFDVCVLTAYIYQRYATRDRLFDYAHINDMTYLEKIDMLLKINDLLNDNYRNYMTSLTKAIYVHIIQQSPDFVDLKTRLKSFRKRNG